MLTSTQSNVEETVRFVTLRCTNDDCLSELRIGRVLKQPITRQQNYLFCSVCGSQAMACISKTEDYWEHLAQEYDVPVEGLKAIYGIWNIREHPNLRDFVEEMKKEAEMAS